MHEMPIAVSIVDRAVEVANEHGASQIEKVEVEVGVMRQVVPEALELAFRMVAEGTPAELAELRIIEQKLIAVCNDCECMFMPEMESGFICPGCEKANARIVAGNDIILKTVVCEVDDEVSQ